jgi:hypothetical protein
MPLVSRNAAIFTYRSAQGFAEFARPAKSKPGALGPTHADAIDNPTRVYGTCTEQKTGSDHASIDIAADQSRYRT